MTVSAERMRLETVSADRTSGLPSTCQRNKLTIHTITSFRLRSGVDIQRE